MKVFFVAVLTLYLSLFSCNNQAFALTAVSPNTVPTGSPDTHLILSGSAFNSTAHAVLNNSEALPTMFVSANQLDAILPASAMTASGTATVRILELAGGQGPNETATASLSITISNVSPTLTAVSPAHAFTSTSSPITVTLTGTNFNNSSVANWNGAALPTTFVSGTSLTAIIPVTNFGAAGTDKITVTNPGPGGTTTASLNFVVVGPLSVSTATLPGGSINAAYTATLAASGGTPPYSWAVTSGTLPVGLTLNATTGVISGTPTAAGSASFTVTVTDSSGNLSIRKFK